MNTQTQQFLEACESGDLITVERMVGLGVDTVVSDSLGLRLAARENHAQVVKFLLPYSNPKAHYSEALRAAFLNKNKDLIDLLWDVSEILCDDGEYLSGFYLANTFGFWDKVLPLARTQAEKIHMVKWAYVIISEPSKTTQNHCIQEVKSTILSHIKNEEVIQAVCLAIKNGVVKNWDFFNCLLDQTEDADGHIIEAAALQSESIMRLLIHHPHYKTLIPQINHHKLAKTIPLLIKSNDLLGLMRILPNTAETLDLYIIEAFECSVPEIWNLILETKRPNHAGDPNGVSWKIACRAHQNPLKAVEFFRKFSELSVVPLFYALSGTPEENLLLPFVSRCTENEVLSWSGEKAQRMHMKIPYVHAFWAQLQNQTLHAHLSDTDHVSVSKRI